MSNALTARMALAKHGFSFTHSLGQNFLLDDGVISRIASEAGVGEGANVLEIGAGAGVLTAELASRGAKVLALEIDRSLEPVLQEVLAAHASAQVVFQDAMKADIAQLTADAFGPGARFMVVANLPYYITADVLLRLVRSGLPIDAITVMVQQEAADRIMARLGTKSWCALSATIQYFGNPEVRMQVPPQAFTPPPHVMSCLLRIGLYREKPVQAVDDGAMLQLIGCAFAMRRKTLLNNLTAFYSMPRERAQALIEASGLDARVRGEALSINQLAVLADKIHNRQMLE